MSMMDAADVPTPALDKLVAVRNQSEAIGPFLEWLRHDGTHLMRRGMAGRKHEGWLTDSRTINQLIAEYLDLDLDAMEDERRAILEAINA